MFGFITIVVLVLLFIFWLVSIYNGLVTARNRYKNGFAQIDVQLIRRHDLIPNLVESAKGYMKHERETLDAVIKARNMAMAAGHEARSNPGDPGAMSGLSGAETMLNGALGKFFALAESYPDLKANQNVAILMEELSSTENKLAFARQAFNDAVMFYNILREKFPNQFIAGGFGFGPAQLLQSTKSEEERSVPKVSF